MANVNYANAPIYPSRSVGYSHALTAFNQHTVYPLTGGWNSPNTVKDSGYNVIYNLGTTDRVMYVSPSASDNKCKYQDPTTLTTNSYVGHEESLIFLSNPAVFDYTSIPIQNAISASTTGNCYDVVMRSITTGTTHNIGFVLNRIGTYAEKRNELINNNAVVLNSITMYEQTSASGARISRGAKTRNGYGTWRCMSVSRSRGRSVYNADGSKNETSAINNSDGIGLQLCEALPFCGVHTTGVSISDFFSVENTYKAGGRILVFDTNSADKSGQSAVGANLMAIAVWDNSETFANNVGGLSGLPYVINNPTAAANTPISELPNQNGVPSNETSDTAGSLDPTKPDNRPVPDNHNDPIDNPSAPSVSPLAAGNRIFAMNVSELEQTFNFLWEGKNKEFLGITLSEVDITRALTTAFFLPFDIANADAAHTRSSNVTAAGYSSDIVSREILSGYTARANIGEITVRHYYGSFLDYAPYTSINIYLPYIGYRQLDPSMIMGKTIGVDYGVELSQGACTAYIYFYDENGHKNIFTMFSGQMGIPVKITGTDDTNVEQAQNTALFSIVKFVGAAGCALAAPVTGGLSTVGTVALGMSAINDTIVAENTDPAVVSAGSSGGENNLYSPQGVYLIIQRPRTSTASNFVDVRGWATNYGGKVSDFTGFLACSSVMNNVPCTETERDMITELLKRGIYI